jgi:DNA-binding NarL/FixJ family response regulator
MTEVAVVADEATERARATEILARAGIVEGDAAGDRLLLLLLSGDVAARLDAIRDAAGGRDDRAIVATLPDDAGNDALRRALNAGAAGIVLDGDLERALAPSVCAVLAGQLAVPGRLRRPLGQRHLSHREKQVLSLVVSGYTNRQIANELFLAESTVKTHLSSAFGKIGARSRAEAAAVVLDPELGYQLALTMAPVLAGRAEDPGATQRSIAVHSIEQGVKL